MLLNIIQNIGHLIEDMFEKQCAWYIDTGIFYFSGRDVCAILIGICAGIILMLIFRLLEGSDEK